MLTVRYCLSKLWTRPIAVNYASRRGTTRFLPCVLFTKTQTTRENNNLNMFLLDIRFRSFLHNILNRGSTIWCQNIFKRWLRVYIWWQNRLLLLNLFYMKVDFDVKHVIWTKNITFIRFCSRTTDLNYILITSTFYLKKKTSSIVLRIVISVAQLKFLE